MLAMSFRRLILSQIKPVLFTHGLGIEKFEGHWTNNTEGFIDGTPDFLLKNAGDVLIKFDLNIKGGEVRESFTPTHD